MTDQPEPKYEIGQSVELFTGLLGKIEEHTDYDSYKLDNGLEVWPGQIKCAVAIHPIEHHKCKDCEHFDPQHIQIQPDIRYTMDELLPTCPIYAWVLNNFKYYLDSDGKDIENLEPPPNCYCFRKGDKLSPDEKESNGKDM